MHAATLLHRSSLRAVQSLAVLALVFAATPMALAGIPTGPAAEGPNLYLARPTEADPTLAPPAALPGEAAPTAELPAAPADGRWSMSIAPALLAEAAASGAAGETPAAPAAAEKPQKGPPLPLHTTEGAGGALFVPFAYLVNPAPPGKIFGAPSPSFTFVKLAKKSISQFVITENIAQRIEVGYTLGILDLGDWPKDVRTHTGIDIELNHVTLHEWTVRGMLVEESKYIPAITPGVTFKYNPDVRSIDRRLHGTITRVGLARSNGTDFTLTASKTIPNVIFGRPIMASAGLRFSQAAQLGYLGFGDAYRLTWEADVCCPITDWFALSYEYRAKKNPFVPMRPLVGNEDDWHAICMAFIISPRFAIACGWGNFGNVVNHKEDGVWGFQLKYEF